MKCELYSEKPISRKRLSNWDVLNRQLAILAVNHNMQKKKHAFFFFIENCYYVIVYRVSMSVILKAPIVERRLKSEHRRKIASTNEVDPSSKPYRCEVSPKLNYI